MGAQVEDLSRRTARLAGVLLVGLGVMTGVAAEGGKATDKLQATLEVIRPFTYLGEPLLVRVAVFNTSGEPIPNEAGVDLLGGLTVASSTKGKLDGKGKAHTQAKEQPAVIAPGGFFGVIHDLGPMVPSGSETDTYTISWRAGALAADPVTVKVLPKFDPTASYVAVIETDYGYLEFDLMSKEAPKHVQNFYDLALVGFYNDTTLFRIVKGVEARGGDAVDAGRPRLGYALEPEISAELKHKRGTLSMSRVVGNQDDASQFVVTLGPVAEYDGNLSIFGQLRSGEDTLKAIEAIPTSGQIEPPHFRPIKPVVLRSVTVKKAEAARAGS